MAYRLRAGRYCPLKLASPASVGPGDSELDIPGGLPSTSGKRVVIHRIAVHTWAVLPLMVEQVEKRPSSGGDGATDGGSSCGGGGCGGGD